MDHPSNNKCGWVCIDYKNFLHLRVYDISLLDECINFELEIGDKLCRFIALYRSPSQTQDDFLLFSQNFELTFENLSENNPYLLVAIRDFDAKLRHWYSQDSNTFEGISIENIAFQFGLHQLGLHHHVTTSSLHHNLTWSLIQGPTLHYIQTVTTKLFMQNLISKFIIPHVILARFGTIKIQMMILSKKQLTLNNY